ncbi:MAG TPA: BTAD domain-containing putative transcriptional regulator [Longimicrobium sp.]|uniref:BTAD domain-containing putative transcriptional regulator n=1 Tax=Longimicrobium sp. TaxID=2029185 RepID=UPI002ED81276
MIFIHVLGAPVVRRPDGPISGRAAHRRRLALLAILAAARGRPVGRERIIGLLWAEHPASDARHTLSESLYVLRKDLGDESFVVVGDEVGLDPAHVWCDLDDFQRAVDEGRWEDAVRAYGGPFLDGFYVNDAPEFEQWVDGERDRLARAWARALEELATAAEAAGEPLRAAEWWRRLLAHDAFSSRVAVRLVRALASGGERAAALRAADAHVLLLRDELGVGPDPELCALMAGLRRAPPAPPPRPAPPPFAALPTEEPVDEDRPAADAVAEMAPLDAPPADADPSPSIVESAPAPTPDAVSPPRRRTRVRRMGVIAAAGMGALAASLLLVVLAARKPAPPVEPQYDPRRIAVLYLDDDSRDGELQYLANGLTEMLIHELSQVQALDVVSRNGVKPYREGTVHFDSMVADLRVGTVVEGSVARWADSVRVVVQLIDANTHSHLESKVVVRPMDDLFAVQRAVSEEVSGFVRRRVGAQARLRQAEAETRSAAALELVLRGEQAYGDALTLRRSTDPAAVASAMRMLHEADALLARAEAADPRWARPPLDRAWVAVRQASWGEPGWAHEAAVDSALARAGRVLARQPAHARALEARGAALWTAALVPGASPELMERAERDLRAAVAAEPRLASAWGKLSAVLMTRGRMAESEMAIDHALRYDAWLEDAGELLNTRFYALIEMRDYTAAAETCARGRLGFPRDWRFLECRLTLMRLGVSGPPDPALAWRLVAELEAMNPPAAAAAGGYAYAPVYRRMAAAAVSARAGDAARARAELARARVDAALEPESRVSLAYDEAYLLLLLGDRAGARERLDAYLAQRPALRGLLARDPMVRELMAARGAAP